MRRSKENYAAAKKQVDEALNDAGYRLDDKPTETLFCTKRTLISAWKTPNDKRILILVRTQTTKGTTNQKIPFFIVALWVMVSKHLPAVYRAYIVLCGDEKKWNLRDTFQAASTKLSEKLEVVLFDSFTKKVKKKEL